MIKNYLRDTKIYQNYISPFHSMIDWRRRSYTENSPQFIKQKIFIKYGIPNSIWIETGTFLGTTTAFLAKNYPKVISIEPEPIFFKNAQKKFLGQNVVLHNARSEDVFPEIIPYLTGNVNFWLDGHYSGGNTFKGPKGCPIENELSVIASNLKNLEHVAILIDDIRCFLPQNSNFNDYPSIDYLIDWAKKNMLLWRIEHDIFIMTSPISTVFKSRTD
jgi:hypothetical protein